MLLIDDIQFIAGKESTQEEFFHTFNTLHGQDKQIVMSSDRPPKAMVTLEERLRSRFEWGLTVDIQPPDLETRIAILRSKAERAGPPGAERHSGNDCPPGPVQHPRAGRRADPRAGLFRPERHSRSRPQLVNIGPGRSAAAAQHAGTAPGGGRWWPLPLASPANSLLGRDRSREIALPRQVAMYLMREEANVSLPQIGEALGGRDHTTVMYACDKVADMIERDDRLRRQVIQLREQLFGRTQLAA